MKAILFSAGLGTRLYPITKHKPKALVEIKDGMSALSYNVRHLTQHGVTEIFINIHHHPAAMIDAIKKLQDEGFNLSISDEQDELLETGGAMVKLAQSLSEEDFFLAYNVDVICNIDIKKLVANFKQKNCLAMLAVRKRNGSRALLFDQHKHLKGWMNKKTDETISHAPIETLDEWAFSGIHIINHSIFDHLPKTGKFSITPHYVRLAKINPILAYPHQEDFWFDIGKPNTLSDACQFFESNPNIGY